ncbi:hypothetical protein EPE80_07220, partial [Campylobacter coli]|nr:hypothetical protein [Campylobacter coli]EAH7761397.1 hypothetical protein [Campylobacter coli]EAH8155875.1 hypothetical protein [Campylobacter coli]
NLVLFFMTIFKTSFIKVKNIYRMLLYFVKSLLLFFKSLLYLKMYYQIFFVISKSKKIIELSKR